MWLTDSALGTCSNVINPLEFDTECVVTANAAADSFQIKGSSYGVTFDSITVTKVVAEKVTSDKPVDAYKRTKAVRPVNNHYYRQFYNDNQ